MPPGSRRRSPRHARLGASTSNLNQLIHVQNPRGHSMTQHNSGRLKSAAPRCRLLAALRCTTAGVALLYGTLAPAAAAAPPAQPEFDGQCVEALAEGKHVTTNCTTTWTDKDGKTYCFS